MGLQVPRVLPLYSGLSNFELLILVRLNVLGEVVAAHEALALLQTAAWPAARRKPSLPVNSESTNNQKDTGNSPDKKIAYYMYSRYQLLKEARQSPVKS